MSEYRTLIVVNPDALFDGFGRPLTAAAARGMSRTVVQRLVVAHIVRLSHRSEADVLASPPAEDGSATVLSQVSVNVYSELLQHLDSKFNVGGVPRKKWASIAGLVDVIMDAYSTLKGK